MPPLCWGEGFLFSVPAVFLLFNLNTQTSMQLHPREWERLPQLGPVGCLGNLLSISTPPEALPPAACCQGTLLSRAGALVLRRRGEEGGSWVLLAWTDEQALLE